MPARIALLLLVISPTVLVIAVVAALATPHWLPVTAGAATWLVLLLSPYVFAPGWYTRAGVRAWSVSDADTARWKGPGLP